MKTLNERIIGALQPITANIRGDDSTHRFAAHMLNASATTYVKKTTSVGYRSASLSNVVDQPVQLNITPNKPIVSVVSLPAADFKLRACMPMTCYPVSTVNALVVTPMVSRR